MMDKQNDKWRNRVILKMFFLLRKKNHFTGWVSKNTDILVAGPGAVKSLTPELGPQSQSSLTASQGARKPKRPPLIHHRCARTTHRSLLLLPAGHLPQHGKVPLLAH